MKITICGSMDFAKNMLESKESLENKGHKVEIPCDAIMIANGQHNPNDPDENFKHCIRHNVIMDHFKLIADSDAILVLNYPKNKIDGYVGGSSLMEIGLAYFLHKKIFLLYPPPKREKMRYSEEIKLMNPIVLAGNLDKIK